MELKNILLWTFITLAISSLSGILGKRFTVAYPIGVMCALTVISDILACKMVYFMGMEVPAGVIVASSTFLITDILSEKWGKEWSKQAVIIGFYCKIILLILLWIGISWPAAESRKAQAEMFTQVLGMTPRITIASIVAYFFSQYHDVISYHYWMKKTSGKHLWLRNNASTMISQLIDTGIFSLIAFYGVIPLSKMILHLWAVKLLIAFLDTPFIYLVTWLMDCFNDKKGTLKIS